MKVLLVGSDPELTRLTGRILRRGGYDVRCALSPEEAEAALEAEEFALVVLDCEPGEARRKKMLAAVRGRGGPRILCISASPEDEVPCLNAGADDWIKTPYHVDVLLARMAALLRQEPALIKKHHKQEG